mmetsp:Transcript_30141/g.36841  ORF Transcript_30141/g.36841 Transcript_30141/m.36841 type:complete len:165 (+) Transcript_30141:24-518(+)
MISFLGPTATRLIPSYATHQAKQSQTHVVMALCVSIVGLSNIYHNELSTTSCAVSPLARDLFSKDREKKRNEKWSGVYQEKPCGEELKNVHGCILYQARKAHGQVSMVKLEQNCSEVSRVLKECINANYDKREFLEMALTTELDVSKEAVSKGLDDLEQRKKQL